MAKGYAAYIIEEVRQMEEEFLQIALEKCSPSYNDDNEQLFENITFKD